MKLAVFGHCTMDTITLKGSQYRQPGGPACYCGITAREFKADVELYTRFGRDFPAQYLTDRGISFSGALADAPTTAFSIDIVGAERTLRLESRCSDITYESLDADGTLVSPICGEISSETLARIKGDSEFLMVDPQGFLRAAGDQGIVSLASPDMDLAGVDAIKTSPDEGRCMTGAEGLDMARSLQKRGVRYVLLTDKSEISMLHGDRMYSITLPNKEIHDTTGIGDIFCAAFCCTLLRERDFLWALCFAGGAAQAALDSKNVGLQKIPKKSAVTTNASYFYNLVEFRTIA